MLASRSAVNLQAMNAQRDVARNQALVENSRSERKQGEYLSTPASWELMKK